MVRPTALPSSIPVTWTSRAGLLETALPIGGKPVEPIAGHPTYSIDGKALVTMTSRLMIASATREPIAEVIERTGGGGSASLADNEAVSETLAMRSHDLMFFCLNFEPVMPMVKQVVQQASRRDPELRAAMAFLDIESTSTLAGRAGVDEGRRVVRDGAGPQGGAPQTWSST